jgi:hypothetical protein
LPRLGRHALLLEAVENRLATLGTDVTHDQVGVLVDRFALQPSGQLVERVTHLPAVVMRGALLKFAGEMLPRLGRVTPP